jgi:hypothetical protein
MYPPRGGGIKVAQDFEALDISDNPDLLRLAEEVRRSKTPRVLQWHGEDVAIVIPPTDDAKRRAKRSTIKRKSAADIEAFLSSAGGWKDVDTDRLKADIYESRRLSTRPRPDL